jgi:hypothetical protein
MCAHRAIRDNGTGLIYMRDLLVMDDDIRYLRSFAYVPTRIDRMLASSIESIKAEMRGGELNGNFVTL